MTPSVGNRGHSALATLPEKLQDNFFLSNDSALAADSLAPGGDLEGRPGCVPSGGDPAA